MEQELYHYGILGMKWGIRRYQNKDGSLTEAGRKRYAGAKGQQKLQKDVSQIEAKVRKLESKKPTNKILKEVEYLKTAKEGLVNNLDHMQEKSGKDFVDREYSESKSSDLNCIEQIRKNDRADREFDDEIFKRRNDLLESAKNGKYEMTFVEAIQNDYDDWRGTEEEKEKDIFTRYEQYVYSPSSWLRINSEYRGLSTTAAADKIYRQMMKDTGGVYVDDPELYELMIMEYSGILSTAGLDSDSIMPIAEKKYRQTSSR